MPDPMIYWIRDDFRFQDNSALSALVEAGHLIVPVFLYDPEEGGEWAPGGAGRWWLHRALETFGAAWEQQGGRLILRQTADPLETLRELAEECAAKGVVWNRRYTPHGMKIDATVKRALADAGLEVKSYQNALLVEPHSASTGAGRPYKVYTPFWRAVKDRTLPEPPSVDLRKLRFPDQFPASEALADFSLLPDHRWPEKLEAVWTVGEEAALEMLDRFLDEGVADYATARDIPSQRGTSRLSPYLRWGHIGPRTVAARLKAKCDLRKEGPGVYLKEIYWREFAYNVLYHFPDTLDQPLRPEYKNFPWKKDAQVLRAWQRGRTGYPIVDAGMRELYETGWMHNRVRMVVSSFLVKHLLQPWQDGARWFWDTLVDSDAASNTLGWQWSAGCGADAAPYFRIFNPMTQGAKFDAEGDYVRRWVPELKSLDDEYIHQPWEAPASVLKRAGIVLGETYPKPIIDHKEGRERALAALAELKEVG